MPLQLAKDGEVSLVYQQNGKSYAVELTKEQHDLLQKLISPLGKVAILKDFEVDVVQKDK